MTAPLLARPVVAAPRTAVLVLAGGCAVLTGRPLLLDATGVGPAPLFGTLFVVLLAVSLLWPAPGEESEVGAASPVLPVLALGIGAFVAGRILLAGSPPPAAPTALVIGLNTLAAFSEEAFFRRFAYGVLLTGGPALAVGGSAVLFAAVHVSVYGLWILPLDLAAGLLFAWQRRATGSWVVPGVTHAMANLLVVL